MSKVFMVLFILTACVVSFNAQAAVSNSSENLTKSESLKKSYNRFAAILSEETNKKKAEIKEVWKDTMLTTSHRWVKYYDYARAHYQFYTGTLTLEILIDPDDDIFNDDTRRDAVVRSYMRRFLLEDFNSIYMSTPYYAAEVRIMEEEREVLSSALSTTKLVELIKADEEDYLSTGVNAIVDKMLSDGKITIKESAVKGVSICSIALDMPPEGMSSHVKTYYDALSAHAESLDGWGDVLFAIAVVESNMNAMAVSSASAYGIMQVVPHTAGIEVSNALYGEPLLMVPSYFMNAEYNIEAGVTYLKLLNDRYFKDVKDPQARIYCVISAYNTGPSNVARAFVGERDLKKAIAVINGMSSEQVYQQLITKLPYKETRNYLQNVAKRAEII